MTDWQPTAVATQRASDLMKILSSLGVEAQLDGTVDGGFMVHFGDGDYAYALFEINSDGELTAGTSDRRGAIDTWDVALTESQILASVEKFKAFLAKPSVVCLCGSTRFSQAFRDARLSETINGRIVLTIGSDTKSDKDLELDADLKRRLDILHLRKIDLADEILVLNVGGYVGESTQREIAYAVATSKAIRWLDSLAGKAYMEANSDDLECLILHFGLGSAYLPAMPGRRSKQVADPEIQMLSSVLAVLAYLDVDARRRVLTYACSRYLEPEAIQRKDPSEHAS